MTYVRGKVGRKREAKQGVCARLGRADARGKAGLLRDARQRECAREARADAPCNVGQMAMQGRADS
jgi:hypothetical protein